MQKFPQLRSDYETAPIPQRLSPQHPRRNEIMSRHDEAVGCLLSTSDSARETRGGDVCVVHLHSEKQKRISTKTINTKYNNNILS